MVLLFFFKNEYKFIKNIPLGEREGNNEMTVIVMNGQYNVT
jgi:hypothetical protein